MNSGLIPARYAKALYEVAQERGQEKEIYALCTRMEDAFRTNPELQKMLANPFVNASDKEQLLTTAAAATVADVTFKDFLKLLIQNRRMDMARDIARAYCDLYRRKKDIRRVEIVTAGNLPDEQIKRLKQLVEKHVKAKTIQYEQRVDPDLIGGFVVNVDNERLDASVKNELKLLRQSLLR
ncbi:MAG: F0F1 ATP synthase subunit delta [Muribaculaceae bacterium]|nr:F0F1 ATP synthase subunit delta [Muribaculaceae bacterium]